MRESLQSVCKETEHNFIDLLFLMSFLLDQLLLNELTSNFIITAIVTFYCHILLLNMQETFDTNFPVCSLLQS